VHVSGSILSVGADVICAEMVANPMQLYTEDGGQSLAGPDEIQFLLTIRYDTYSFIRQTSLTRVHRDISLLFISPVSETYYCSLSLLLFMVLVHL